jgi:hypothetical protein
MRESFTMAPIKIRLLKTSPKKSNAAVSAFEDAPVAAVARRTRASSRLTVAIPSEESPSATMAPVSQTPHDVVESKSSLLFL